MINDGPVQVDRSIVIHQIFMKRIPSGMHLASDHHHIPNAQGTNLLLADWRMQSTTSRPLGSLGPESSAWETAVSELAFICT